jgi:hypothetical protein
MTLEHLNQEADTMIHTTEEEQGWSKYKFSDSQEVLRETTGKTLKVRISAVSFRPTSLYPRTDQVHTQKSC